MMTSDRVDLAMLKLHVYKKKKCTYHTRIG